MKQKIPRQQYAVDFKQVVLHNSVYSIERYFDGNPELLLETLKRYKTVQAEYKETGARIPNEEFHALLQKIEQFNYALSIPTSFVKSMFHTLDGKQTIGDFLTELAETDQIRIYESGVLTTKTAVKHFPKRYLANLQTLKEIFADEELLKKTLDPRSDLFSKRQYRFISKLKNIKKNPMDEQQVFINPNKRYTRRRLTKKELEALNADIPEEVPEVAAPKKVEPQPTVQIVANPEDMEKKRELDKRLYPYSRRIVKGEITKEAYEGIKRKIMEKLGLSPNSSCL